VCEALAARDRHCADLKANVDDLTRQLAAGKSHCQELETKLRLMTDDRDATHFQVS
jgi:flagellar biosynthesis chaperone FliJ